MDSLRRSKSAATMGARSDGVDISDVSSFAESGKTTPSFLTTEYITEPSENLSAKHSRAGSEIIEEYVEGDEKDLEDDLQIKEFRTGSIASSDNISQYLDKEERGPGNSNTNEESSMENDKKEESRDKRAKSEETAKRKRKLSAESSYSRYSLSKLGVMKKLRDAKTKLSDAKNKIKVPKLSFPTKKVLKKRTSPPKDDKKEDKPKKESKKGTKKTLEPTRVRKTDNPVYIHIPLKPPPGETDEFSYLEFEPKKINGENGLNNKSDEPKSGEVNGQNTENKIILGNTTENNKDEKMEVDETKNQFNGKEDIKKDDKRNSPFSSLERGPRVTKKPPLKINPAFKQFLKDVRQLKDKEMDEVPEDTDSEDEKEVSKDITRKDANIETTEKPKSKESKSSELKEEEHLDLEEQQTSDSEAPKEDVFDKLFEASASKKEPVSSKSVKKESGDPSSSPRNVRSKSAEPERKRKSSIDSSYSRKSLSKLGIIKKLKEASEKIKGAFSLSSLKRNDSKKEKESKKEETSQDKSKKDDKENKVKKPKLTAQEKISQLGKPKIVEPVYIHIPLKPPAGEIDEFSHLESASRSADIVEPKKEERTDSLDSMSPVSTKNDDIQFIFLTPPSDDELLDYKEPDIPETPSSDESPVFFGSLKKLAERAVDQVSPETRKKALETVSEEADKGQKEEPTGKKDGINEEPPLSKEEVKAPSKENQNGPPSKEEDEEVASLKPDEDTSKNDESVKPVAAEKMIVDVEDGLNEPPKIEELKSVLKTSSSESTSPILKKKVSFKRKTKPTKTKTDTDNGYEPIEVPKDEKTINLLEQAGLLAEKADFAGKMATTEDNKESNLSHTDKLKKKLLVGDISQSMSMDDEKGYLDQKIVKDTSLEEDYNKWSKSGDHEYEPINPPDEVILMTSSVIPGVTVIDTNNEPKVVLSAAEILEKPMEEKKKSFFQFGRFNRDKVQGDVEKGQGHGGSSDDRSRSSQGQEVPKTEEPPRTNEGPNKFQVAFRQRTDQLKNKTNELRNKVRNIHMPKAPEFKRPEFKKPESKKSESKKREFKKPNFKKPDFKKFKFEKPKINLHLPKIPDTATIHFPHVSLPGAKKITETRTVETRQYSTESNAGDSGSTKHRSKFDFDFSRTFPRFKKKKAADDQTVKFGTTPRAKKNKDVEKGTTESSTSSIRIPLHSEDSLDTDERLNYNRERDPDRETSEDIDHPSRMRFDNDIAIEDDYERENQEINRAEYLNRWQHGNARSVGTYVDDGEEFDNEDERIVEQLVEQRFKKVGPDYGQEKEHDPHYERYEDDHEETLEDRLRRDEDRPRYSDDEEEFDRRLMRNKDLITDLDNLEDDETGVQIRDGYSSEGSVGLQNKGRLGKLDIDSDEFFVVHEIREGFQTPANALAQMNEYDPIGSNRSLPQAPPSKRKPIKKPKRKKTPHVSQEEIPGEEESVDGVRLPSRPKRKSKKNKKKPDDGDIVPYQKTIHLEFEDAPNGERLHFPRESLGILGDDERDDQEFEMYENEKMEGKEQPDILVTDPYKEFQIREQQIRAREEAESTNTEPMAPPRRHRSLKSLSQSENESILADRYEDRNLELANIESYIIPSHQIEAPPRRPGRKSRSHTSSLSRVSLPPSQRDTDSLLADEAFLTENQPIPSYLIENQSYKQKFNGNQAVPYLEEEPSMQPCVEEPCIQDLRDYMGYSIVDKSRQREPPLPPPRTPPRRKRQINPEQKFATVPRNVGSSQPETSHPVRPLRNYSTLTQVKSSRKDSSHYENDDKENRGSEIDIGEYIEIEDDLNRDLISGDVVQKMRQRPLPAPPRPPRKSKHTRRSLQDITSKENIMPSSSSPQEFKPSYHVEEETVSTQTEPLPPDFVCEEIHQEPTDTIITPRVNEKIETSIQKQDTDKPQAQKIEETEPQIRRELITPTVYSYEETVTHGSLLVEPLNGAKVVPDHQLSRERLVPVTKEYSDEETSEVPESFRALKGPEALKETQRSRFDFQKPSLEVIRTDKLQVSDLDVDRLRVNELLASKIVVSEIDSSSISTNEIQSKSGALRVGDIELPPRLLEEIVKKLEEMRPSETSSLEQRLQEAQREEKKTSIFEDSSQTLKKQEASIEPFVGLSSPADPLLHIVDPSLFSADPSLSSIDPLVSPVDPSLSPIDPTLDIHDHLEHFPERLEDQHESTVDIEHELSPEQREISSEQHELSPEPPVPPPRSYTLEGSPPDAPPRSLRRKSKDSPRTTDTQRTDQSDVNVNSEKTDEHPRPQEFSQMEMLEPEIDDHPPPRPPEPLEGVYLPSQPPASFYALRAKHYVGLDSENIPTVPRRKRHQKSRSRPVSRSRSTSDDSSLTPSHPHTRSPRSTRRFSEPSIPELSGRLIQACGSRINNSLKRLIYYLTENILRNADGKQDLHVFMIILLVLIAGLILLGYGEDKTVVHLHHWEYFNPPKDL